MAEHSTHPRTALLSDEEVSFCGQSCLVILKELGLRSTLTYLFAYLGQYYPITRIFCGFRHYQDAAFIPVADTLPGGPTTTQYLAGRSLTHEQICTMLVDDSRPYFFFEDPFRETQHRIMRKEDFISHVRVPLFKLGEATFQMGFCSDTENAFDEEDSHIFQRLLQSFSPALEHSLHVQLDKTGSPVQPEQSRTVLRMCEGLSELLEDVDRVAATDCTVLIEGETGVGKDMVANAIHRHSVRWNGPFIKINCGAVSDSLLESELFGHEKGAFTGANSARSGYFEAANGGTIFLDEVGELSPRVQVELLRVLDNREILRVGSTRCIPLDIRVIAATNRDLARMVDEGSFRADLWYRLNLIPLYVPPLRQRRVDIPSLVRLFTHDLSARLGLVSPPSVPTEELEKLYIYDWPGNVRELRNTVERAIIKAKNGTTCLPLRFDMSPKTWQNKASAYAHGAGVSGRNSHAPSLPSPEEIPNGLTGKFSGPLPTLEEFGDIYVQYILKYAHNKIAGPDGAAALLGVHPNTVRQRARRAKGGQRAHSGNL